MASPTSSRVWFITGSSSGFGFELTQLLLAQGDIVIATLRKPSALDTLAASYPPSQLLVLQLDVTSAPAVRAAFARAIDAFGRIDIVFNNAGQNCLGEVEAVDEESARRLLDVNFWGATHVTQEAVRVFREVNRPQGGRLLQVSSRLGLVGGPASGFYSASKFALEGLTESLYKELNPAWNIKVSLIEPGPFRTNLTGGGGNVHIVPPHPAYEDPSLPSAQFRAFITSGAVDGDAVKAVKVVERFSRLENPPFRLPLHKRVIASLRDKIGELSRTVEEMEAWSEDLYFEE
ncbi:NAD(P)-binding protein [Coniophora puteana RWD-64-598 SS2]|uniref:NAD(P)-binding protein n=1 Tax=Coniophora puteana (strain RWD-64-598) TaxID=741705 RepID=A0A5M3MAL8_CONPW|nr:NAD(P)-binding protein [Coniophora puteana RWD-64-598 SS2]EIW75904.1 NAD(P)-binding protein [Coniophora puteana RWD-64-598 SS2]